MILQFRVACRRVDRSVAMQCFRRQHRDPFPEAPAGSDPPHLVCFLIVALWPSEVKRAFFATLLYIYLLDPLQFIRGGPLLDDVCLIPFYDHRRSLE